MGNHDARAVAAGEWALSGWDLNRVTPWDSHQAVVAALMSCLFRSYDLSGKSVGYCSHIWVIDTLHCIWLRLHGNRAQI